MIAAVTQLLNELPLMATCGQHNLITGAVGTLLFLGFFMQEQTKKTVKK
jgi:hypothetical protein